MGQSSEVREYQGRLITASTFHNPPLREFGEADVRFGSKADVTLLNFDVCFTPKSRHSTALSRCPLL